MKPRTSAHCLQSQTCTHPVIVDCGFPFWPMIEAVDVSVVDGIPTVLQVFPTIEPGFFVRQIHRQEFLDHNSLAIKQQFGDAFDGIPVIYEQHDEVRKRDPYAIGRNLHGCHYPVRKPDPGIRVIVQNESLASQGEEEHTTALGGLTER